HDQFPSSVRLRCRPVARSLIPTGSHVPSAQSSSAEPFLTHPCLTSRPWVLQPRHTPSADSNHISVRQIRPIARGSGPRIPTLVMTVIANAIPRPRVQANRLGLADTHSGDRPRVIACASNPIGL